MNKKVLIIVVSLVLVGVILFFTVFNKECKVPEITYDTKSPTVGQLIAFKAATDDENITWNFSDGVISTGKVVTHTFNVAGTFRVKASTSESCFDEKEIIVKPESTSIKVTPSINVPEEIYANEPVDFEDYTDGATDYTWEVQETGQKGKASIFNVKFETSGEFTIALSLKGEGITADTLFNVQVLGASKTKKNNEVIAEKVAPAAKPIVKETAPKTVIAVVPKKEIKTAPVVVAKPVEKTVTIPAEKKVKVEAPEVLAFSTDDEFKSNLIRIYNSLINEQDNASNEWRDKISKQAGPNGSIKVLIKEGAQVTEKTLASFKTSQLSATDPLKVLDVKDIKRVAPKGPINQITLIVSKN
jgi:hypothetical protein